jgi:predicted GNAT family acetyltransferase
MTLDLDSLEIRNNAEQKRFELQIGDEIAFVEYMIGKKNIAFTHTEVPPALEGKGVGGKLAKYVLNWAIENGYKIQPLCPFISAYVRRHPDEYRDHVWHM